jgi:hypothetical protein
VTLINGKYNNEWKFVFIIDTTDADAAADVLYEEAENFFTLREFKRKKSIFILNMSNRLPCPIFSPLKKERHHNEYEDMSLPAIRQIPIANIFFSDSQTLAYACLSGKIGKFTSLFPCRREIRSVQKWHLSEGAWPLHRLATNTSTHLLLSN